ncbi:hypothetical protein QAD02_014446 [Eretmocerus hayati]|uniref:Uncharacterized protein n=1 Tax=Eretmocerus hayati TaxID=131215 RepID=A0ACC2P5W1_9HYME|nr:hypothetical protein QAD02_014446 [Eretmocerus hayati]
MKFFAAIVLVALCVVAAYAAEEPARKLEQARQIEPSNAESPASARGKRGFVVGAYSAPLTAAAVPVGTTYSAAYSAPVAYAAGVPYAYSAYSPYASYYSYPAAAVYV